MRDRLQRVGTQYEGARLYGEDGNDGVEGFGAFFLLLDRPETYGLPPNPRDATRELPAMWKTAALAALGLGALVAGCSLA